MAQVFFESGFTDPESFFSNDVFVDIPNFSSMRNTQNRQILIDMRRWIEKECKESVYIKTRSGSGCIRFFFEDREDAMAFKLRWL